MWGQQAMIARMNARRITWAGAAASLMMMLAACDAQEAGVYSAAYAPQPANERWQFSATTERNIAMLADNPADLDRPRRETPRDAMQRDAVLSAYRAGNGNGGSIMSTSTQRRGGQQ